MWTCSVSVNRAAVVAKKHNDRIFVELLRFQFVYNLANIDIQSMDHGAVSAPEFVLDMAIEFQVIFGGFEWSVRGIE